MCLWILSSHWFVQIYRHYKSTPFHTVNHLISLSYHILVMLPSHICSMEQMLMLMLIVFLYSFHACEYFAFSLAYSGYSRNREIHGICSSKMSWFIETHSASRGFASWPLTPDPWPGAWHLSLIFQCPSFFKSSDICCLAQLTWNASRIWSDGKTLCPWHLSWITAKRGYTLNFH